MTTASDGIKVHGGVWLLNEAAVRELRKSTSLRAAVNGLHKREEQLFRRKRPEDGVAHLYCQRAIASLLDGPAVVCPPVATADPSTFAHSVFGLKGAPPTAPARRKAREVARTYALASQGGLPTVQSVDGFRDLWEAAMNGESRWSDDYPNSTFRTCASHIVESLASRNVIQVNTEPQNIEAELSQLLAFLSDTSLPEELRACAALPAFEFTHPFSDGNGHVGRMLVLSTLQRGYSLQSLVGFSRALATGKRETSDQIGLLRSGKQSLPDFCHAMLGMLERSHDWVLRVNKDIELRNGDCGDPS